MAENWQHRTMRDNLRILFTRGLSGLLILGAVIAMAAGITQFMHKVYQAQVTLMSPLTQAEQTLSGNIRSDNVWELVLKTQHEILTGDTVLSRTLARWASPDLKRDMSPDGLRGIGIKHLQPDSIAAAAQTVDRQEVARFRDKIRMEVPGGQTMGKSQVFTVFVEANTADEAKELTDLLTEEFIYRYHELVLEMLGNRLQATQTVLNDMAQRYEPVRLAYASFLNGRGSLADVAQLVNLTRGAISDVGTGAAQLSARRSVQDLRSQLSGLETLHTEIAAGLVRLDDAKKSGKVLDQMIPIAEEVRRDNPAVRSFTEQLAAKIGQRIQLEKRYTATYQPLVQVKAEIAELQDQLAGVLRAGQQELAARILQLKAEEGAYSSTTDQDEGIKVKAGEAGQVLTDMQKLETNWRTFQDLWQKQLTEYNDSQAAYDTALSTRKIIASDRAVTPDEPIRPILWLNMAIGAIVGVLLALAYVFLADFYDHSVRSTDEVERYLGVPVLASVRRLGRHPIRRS